MFKTRFFSILALLFGLLPCMSLTAYAASVSYVDGNGTSQTVDATELESTTTSWTDGSWYIVPEGGLTISGRIAVSGTVNLILRDGTELTASAGITTTNATLNIYAQSTGTGALTATGANGATYTGGNAGIGGIGVGSYASGGAGGTVNIYGGTVTATGGNGGTGGGGGAGIGGGGAGWNSKEGSGAGGTVNIYGGTVTATGGNGGTGGGGGTGIGGGGVGWQSKEGSGAGGTVNIYGGTVTATGGTGGKNGGGGAGIGGGGNGMTCSAGADGTLTLGVGVKLYNGTDNTGTVLDDNDSESRNYSGSRPQNMFAEGTAAPATKYDLTLATGTEDAANWQGKAGEDDYQELPLTGLEAGTAVSVKYSGTKKVKSVKAVKKAPAAITVTWNNDDIDGSGNSFTKDGVTITAGDIDFDDKDFMGDVTFTTTLGNFTKIEITTNNFYADGDGWSGSGKSGTWTGKASSVPFSGLIQGQGMGNTKFVFTIEPTN